MPWLFLQGVKIFEVFLPSCLQCKKVFQIAVNVPFSGHELGVRVLSSSCSRFVTSRTRDTAFSKSPLKPLPSKISVIACA